MKRSPKSPPPPAAFLWFVFIHLLLVFLISGLIGGASLSSNVWAKETRDQKKLADLTDLSLENLMNIEVTTVSRQESTVGRSPAAIFVITPEMIRRSGATTIPELFRMVPGMDVARLDNNKWNISARGFNGDRFQGKLLLQIDGRTLYSQTFSGVWWDIVDYPLEDIARIEVIRGPGASVWGANAVNGIINIITKPAKETHGELFVGGGGTAEQGFGTARHGGKIGNQLNYRAYAKGFNRDKQFSASGDSSDAWWGARSGLRLDWQASEQDAVSFHGGYFHSDAGRRDFRSQVAAPFSYEDVDHEISNGGNTLVHWARELDNGSNLGLQLYWDYLNRRLTNILINLHWNIVDLDFQHQIPWGERQNLVYGANYRFTSLFVSASGNDSGFAFAPDHNDLDTHLFNGFLQDQIQLVKNRLELTIGSKFERNSYTGVEIQPTGRLLWTPTERQAVWTAVSRAVRTPNFIEHEGTATQPGVTSSAGVTIFPRIISNTNFKSENVVALEAGYRTELIEELAVDIALFYNFYDHMKTLMPGAVMADPITRVSILPLQPQNLMNGKTYGVELGIHERPTDWWRLYGAYTFLKMQLNPDTTLPASSQTSLKASAGQSPMHQIFLQSSFDLPYHLEVDPIGRFVSSLSGFNPSGAVGFSDTVNHYFSVDVRLGWKPIKNLEWEIVGQNLLHNHHAEVGPNPTIRNPLVEIQRSVYGKMIWQF